MEKDLKAENEQLHRLVQELYSTIHELMRLLNVMQGRPADAFGKFGNETRP
jgi:hypothetical protein